MNKQIQTKIAKIEALKNKEIAKRDAINQIIKDYDNQLKDLYDLQKQQDRIQQMQEELNNKIIEK